MKKKTKTNEKKATNRGRPPKKFISKKPQIKRDKPGRPKKHEKILLPLIPEKKDNKIKDIIIRTLFFISFLVFGFSLYISQKENIKGRLYNQNKVAETTPETIEEELIANNNETIQTENIEPEPIEPVAPQDPKYLILQQIYGSLKASNFDEFYSYIDNNLKQSTTFKTYFSKNRLQRFINNIDNQNINIELIEIIEEQSKILYRLTYSIKNIQFIEEWEVTFAIKDNEQKITKIMCTTQGCSRMPFFNPGKYF